MKAGNKHTASENKAQCTPSRATGNKAAHKEKVSSGSSASNAKGSLRDGAKRQPQTQHEGKSAIILSATVFVLCMVCLAAGFYLSSSSSQSEGSIDVWQPLADQTSSSWVTQGSQLPPVAPDPVAHQPLVPDTPVTAKEARSEDSLVPDAQDSAAGKLPAQDEAKVAVSETQSSVQTIAATQAISLAQSAQSKNIAAQPQQTAGGQGGKPFSPVKENKNSCFGIPPAKNGAVLVFIIDDGGYSTEHLEKYTSLPFPLAVAVLPRLPHSVQCAQIVRSSGQELMLHQPMQAKNLNVYPGEGAVLPDMSLTAVYDTVMENLREIGPVRGMNNHEGSLITSDKAKMTAVLDAVKDAGVYFLDSRTSADTVVPQVARERGMRILQRDVFIDDVISEDEMLKQILRGLDIANKNGQSVMIGHVDKSAAILPALLKRMHPELVRQGYSFAFPSELLR